MIEGSPTYAPDISRATLSILNKMKKESFKNLYHFSEIPYSWYQFLKIKKKLKKGMSFFNFSY